MQTHRPYSDIQQQATFITSSSSVESFKACLSVILSKFERERGPDPGKPKAKNDETGLNQRESKIFKSFLLSLSGFPPLHLRSCACVGGSAASGPQGRARTRRCWDRSLQQDYAGLTLCAGQGRLPVVWVVVWVSWWGGSLAGRGLACANSEHLSNPLRKAWRLH
jgi:hypothetical protein